MEEARRYDAEVVLPANALVVLIGASGSGKSSWARRWFRETEIVSSDRCRLLVADDEADQTVNREAFAVFYEIIRGRLSLGKLTVADSTGLQEFSRTRLRDIARRAGAPIHVIVFCTSLGALLENNRSRARNVPTDVLARHAGALREILEQRLLESEGYDDLRVIHAPVAPNPVIVPAVRGVLSAPTGLGRLRALTQ